MSTMAPKSQRFPDTLFGRPQGVTLGLVLGDSNVTFRSFLASSWIIWSVLACCPCGILSDSSSLPGLAQIPHAIFERSHYMNVVWLFLVDVFVFSSSTGCLELKRGRRRAAGAVEDHTNCNNGCSGVAWTMCDGVWLWFDNASAIRFF